MQVVPTQLGWRRADVDSLRALALLLLIVSHVLLVYSGRESWSWYVASSHSGYWADYLITLLQPWRLSLVFFVGGIAARFMLERRALVAFAIDRTTKLLVAFVFTVVVLVPPMRYVRLDDLGVAHGQSYIEYLTQEAPFVVPYLGLRLPDFSHAWFLPYLFVYSILAGVFWRFAPGAFRAWQGAIERMPTSVVVLATMAWFAFIFTAIYPVIPPTGLVLTDIGAHLHFAPLFLLGVLIGKSIAFQDKLGAIKFPLWAVAAALALVNVALEWLFFHDYLRGEGLWDIARGAYGGAMVFSVAAFGRWALNHSSAALTYASDAILPVYLMHQMFLVCAADMIVDLRWPLVNEFPVLFAATIFAPLMVYHLFVRNAPPLRVLFGLRPRLHREKVAVAGPVA